MKGQGRTGRPRFAEGKARGAPLSLRLTPSERAAVDAAAARAGRKLSDWCRDVLAAASRRETT
jgi:uncharacterized protein (DUF1778 family)